MVARAKTQDFSFALAAIDRENRTAQIVGNVGAENLSLIVGLEHETFIEISLSGTVQLTVVFTELPQPPDGRFPAVHSRHARAAAPAHPKLCYQYIVIYRDSPSSSAIPAVAWSAAPPVWAGGYGQAFAGERLPRRLLGRRCRRGPPGGGLEDRYSAPIEADRRAGGGWRPACQDQTRCPTMSR